jgi:hypothetical protein
MLGLSLSAFTLLHVLISLVGIATGLIVVFGMMSGKRLDGLTAIFLLTTVLTSATGFLFPFEHLLPSHIVGAISLVALLIAMVARYGQHLKGASRLVYVIFAVLSLYLNCFVLVVQSFLKVPVLKAAAPTQKEPPFLIAQLVVMVIFIVLGFLSARKFHPA